LGEEDLTIEPAKALPETSAKKASRAENLKQLKKLKKLVD
jgi:hypothetical protein